MDRVLMDRKYLGKKLGQDVTKEEIMRVLNAKKCRVLYSDTMMTLEYLGDRVNIVITYDHAIKRIYMG